jgi:hypothetical protein
VCTVQQKRKNIINRSSFRFSSLSFSFFQNLKLAINFRNFEQVFLNVTFLSAHNFKQQPNQISIVRATEWPALGYRNPD